LKLKPVVSGHFYPAKAEELKALLDSFDSTPAPPPLSGEPIGMLLPHAGYIYSGAVAALGYRSLSFNFETIVVVGPSHYKSFSGISLFAGEAVQTPLGDLPVDQEACGFLLEQSEAFSQFAPAFAKEHSVEVHFPLIQKYCPGAKVVPLITGQGEKPTIRPLVQSLLALRKTKKFLLVASSDLSHYPVYDVAVDADRRFLEVLLQGNENELEEIDEAILNERYPNYYCTHCGKEPISALLRVGKAEKAEKIELLAYRNSGDVTGDLSRVVGYAAVAFSQGKPG
jgi:AmmeMemoRadiSam system protein B